MGVYEEVKQALQDIVAPELKALQVEIRRLDEKIDSLDGKLNARMDSLDKGLNTRIDSLDKSLNARIDSMDKSLNARMDSMGYKIDSLDEKVNGRIDSMDKSLNGRIDSMDKGLSGRIDSLKAEVTTEIKRLDEKIDIAIQIRERLAAIEGRFEERERMRPPAKTKNNTPMSVPQKIIGLVVRFDNHHELYRSGTSSSAGSRLQLESNNLIHPPVLIP